MLSFRTLSQVSLVTLRSNYEILAKIVPNFPCGSAPGNFDKYGFKGNVFEQEKVFESERIQKMLLNNDFPKADSVLLDSDSRDVEFVGEVISRRSEPDEATKKQFLKVKKSLKLLKSMDDMKAFIKEETKCRQECRKKALTKKLEQSDWKELKSTVKSKMEGGDSVATVKLMLMSWILFPGHKGDHLCEEFQALNYIAN